MIKLLSYLMTLKSQAQVNVGGSVTCKEKCDSSVHVALVRLDAKRNEQKQTVGLTESSSKFLFQNVLPGKYKLEVLLHCFLHIFCPLEFCFLLIISFDLDSCMLFFR